MRARPQPHRGRRAVGPEPRPVAAREALRAAHRRMVLARKANDIQRDRVLVKRRELPENQPLRDLGRGEPVHRIEHRGLGGAGPHVAAEVANEVVDLLVAAEAPGDAFPARPRRARPEDRTEERLQAVRPQQHPRLPGGEVAPVCRCVERVEVVGAHDHGEGRGGGTGPGIGIGIGIGTGTGTDRNAHRFEPAGKATVIARGRHPGGAEPLLRPSGRGAEGGPVRGPPPFHGVLARDDIAPGREGGDRFLDLGPRMGVADRGGDVRERTTAIEEREEGGVDPAAEQRVEGLGNEEGLPVADRVKREVRRERRHLDESDVGGGDLLQDPARRARLRRRRDLRPPLRRRRDPLAIRTRSAGHHAGP